jgi:hypothetical protein
MHIYVHVCVCKIPAYAMLVGRATQPRGMTLGVPLEKMGPARERRKPNESLEPASVVVRAHCVAPDGIVYVCVCVCVCVFVCIVIYMIYIYI